MCIDFPSIFIRYSACDIHLLQTRMNRPYPFFMRDMAAFLVSVIILWHICSKQETRCFLKLGSGGESSSFVCSSFKFSTNHFTLLVLAFEGKLM
jgi:hypothetical protein